MRWRPLLVVVLVLAAASCDAGSQAGESPVFPTQTASVPSATPDAVLWQPCGALQCATLEVPLDYTRPNDRKVPLALARRPATGPDRLGALLLNPGGPGESGIDSMGLFEEVLSPELQRRFDVVSFDPRGVGRSEGINCIDGPTTDRLLSLDPAPTTPAGVQALLDGDRTLVEACKAKAADILPFVGTINAARDMDRIRVALGEPALTYFGFSYGTLLGAVYAGLFPTHVRALVLDGAIDPALDAVTDDDAQSVGVEQSLAAFLADCSANPSCTWQPGGDLHAAFAALMASVKARPLVVGDRTVGSGEAYLGVVAQLYSRSTWPQLAQALQKAAHGDGSGLLASSDDYNLRNADGTYPHTLEATTAISCADQRWPTDAGAFPALAAAAAKQAPDFGAANLWSGAVCAQWPVQATLPVGPVRATGSPPILVVGSTGDGITPYVWAQSLSKELQHGVLLTRQGQGHTGYINSACIRNHVDAYLINGTVPAAGTTCL
jgi:pimeloyl-ACP methyl ester carboxylesterase